MECIICRRACARTMEFIILSMRKTENMVYSFDNKDDINKIKIHDCAFYGFEYKQKKSEGHRQVLCANSFTSLAELSLHRAGKPALNYLVAEDRERVKGGEAACEALDVNSVFCYQPASSSCISMYFMLMYFFPPHWVPAT